VAVPGISAGACFKIWGTPRPLGALEQMLF